MKIHKDQLCILRTDTKAPALFRRCEFCRVPTSNESNHVYRCAFAGNLDLTEEEYTHFKEYLPPEKIEALPKMPATSLGTVHKFQASKGQDKLFAKALGRRR